MKESDYIGRYLTDSYQLKTGGILCSLNQALTKSSKSRPKRSHRLELKKSASFLWIPEEIYPFSFFSQFSLDNFNDGSFVKKNEQLFFHKHYPSPFDGFVYLKKQKKKITHVLIKSATVLVFEKKNLNLNKFFKKFHGQFFFPGESLLRNITITKLIFTEVLIHSTRIQLLMRPVILYNLSRSIIYEPKNQPCLNRKKKLAVSWKSFLTIRLGNSLLANLKRRKTFVQTAFFVHFLNSSSKVNLVPNLKITKNNRWLLEFGHSRILNQRKLNLRCLKLQKNQTSLYVRVGQILEPYTIMGAAEFFENRTNKIVEIKSKYSKPSKSQQLFQQLVVVTDQETLQFYTEETTPFLVTNKFIFAGDLLANTLLLTRGGKIYTQLGTKIQFRLGKPFLFTEGAKLSKNHLDFVPANTVLGFVTYHIFKTQDIIQGLPKVEEILEARGPKPECVEKSHLMNRSGLIINIEDSLIEYFTHDLELCEVSQLSFSIPSTYREKIEVKPYQYLKYASPYLILGRVDPQEILDIYFNHFYQWDSYHKATLRSLYRLVHVFMKSVQLIYENEGIKILDRHLEVIFRQMICKAEIEYPGHTPLVQGEYLEFQELLTLNKMLEKKGKDIVLYKPSILGLTKAALKTESFLAAASFQQTIRILTLAAIEGKVDWLRGLKEKVIVGGLLPSGTGLLTFLDEWIVKHIFLYGRSLIARKTRYKLLRSKLRRAKKILEKKEKDKKLPKQKPKQSKSSMI